MSKPACKTCAGAKRGTAKPQPTQLVTAGKGAIVLPKVDPTEKKEKKPLVTAKPIVSKPQPAKVQQKNMKVLAAPQAKTEKKAEKKTEQKAKEIGKEGQEDPCLDVTLCPGSFSARTLLSNVASVPAESARELLQC